MLSGFKYFGRCLLSLAAIGCATAAQCQDIEPRRWTPLPPGLNVIGAGYVLTNGDVYFDPALQVEDATVRGHTVGMSYVRSFRLAGKLARFDMVLPWSYELTTSVFLYADNDEFFRGVVREQDPLLTVQGHVIRTFNKRGYWLSLSAGHGGKGQSIINAAPVDDEKRLFLSALSFGMPLGDSQGLKFAYVRSRTKRNNGADTDSLLASWTLRF